MMIGTQWLPHFPPEILAQVGGQDVPSGYRDEMLRGPAPGYQSQMDWRSIALGFALMGSILSMGNPLLGEYSYGNTLW